MSTFRITFDEDSDITPDEAAKRVLDFVGDHDDFDEPSVRTYNSRPIAVDLMCFDATGNAAAVLKKSFWGASSDIHNVSQKR